MICDNDYIDNDVKVRDVTAKCRAPTHRDCNINDQQKIMINILFSKN